MTVRTGGGDHETGFGQTLPMNTHIIMLNNLMLVALVQEGRLLTFAVTLGTELWNISGKNRRLRVRLLPDTVPAVTLYTGWGIGIILGNHHAMGTLAIKLGLLGMADGAVNRRLCGNFAQWFTRILMIKLDIHMTFNTGNPLLLMNGVLKLLCIHKQAYFIPVGQDLLEIRIAVTIQAKLIIQAVLIQHPSGLMGAMTFNTGRNLMGFFFPQFAPDNLGMGSLNIRMTLHAGSHNIIPADRGIWIGMGQNIMGGMTAAADSGDGQPLTQETFAVNGHGIVFQDVLFLDIMGLGHGAALLMTAAASGGHVHDKGPGFPVTAGLDIMLTVAVLTIWRKRIFVLNSLTMQTIGIDFPDNIMTILTTDRSHWKRMFITLDIGLFVAGDTVVVSMHGLSKGIPIHIQVKSDPVLFCTQVLVTMTLQTIGIAHGPGILPSHSQDKHEDE